MELELEEEEGRLKVQKCSKPSDRPYHLVLQETGAGPVPAALGVVPVVGADIVRRLPRGVSGVR